MTDHPATAAEVAELLDDLAALLDVTAATADVAQRRRAVAAASRVRLLRARHAPPDEIPPATTPGAWYPVLAAALGETRDLPYAALADQLDQIERLIDRRRGPHRRRP